MGGDSPLSEESVLLSHFPVSAYSHTVPQTAHAFELGDAGKSFTVEQSLMNSPAAAD